MPGTLKDKSSGAALSFEVRADGAVVGPVTLDQLRRGWEAGKIPQDAEVREATGAQAPSDVWRTVPAVLAALERTGPRSSIARDAGAHPPGVGISEGTQITPNVRLVRPLGTGGMGSVWLAEHAGLQTTVAVKLVRADVLAKQPDAVARFRREAAAAAKIRSPHVVQMLDYGLAGDGTAYIVMEFLDGETLAARIAHLGRVPPRDAATVLMQVAKALTAAHAMGIVHRDIKPENIVLTMAADELVVKVLDFGIAKERAAGYDALTGASSLVGTPAYMSPEQIVSARDVDHSADVWALAVVAFEMLTGRVPFAAETVGGLIVEITSSRYTQPSALVPDLPGALDVVFSRAFSRDPARRFGSVKALADAVASCLLGEVSRVEQPSMEDMRLVSKSTGLPIEAPALPPGPGTFAGASRSVGRGRPRGRVLAAIGATGIAAVLVVAAVAAVRGRSPGDHAQPAQSTLPHPIASAEQPEEPRLEPTPVLVTPAPSADAPPVLPTSSASAKRPKPTAPPRDRKERLGF